MEYLNMKKTGFTLAEVLITLGIIGVVAALTAPSLIQSAGNAQVGPKLAKAKSTIEIGLEKLLEENEAQRLSGVFGKLEDGEKGELVIPKALEGMVKFKQFNKSNNNLWSYETYDGKKVNAVTYADALTYDYWGIASLWKGGGTNAYVTPDNMMYYFNYENYSYATHQGLNDVIGAVTVDINGAGKPNKLGKDTFGFYIINNGTLEPFGASGDRDKAYHWANGTSGKCNEDEVTGNYITGLNCTGSIFENNLKVIYQ